MLGTVYGYIRLDGDDQAEEDHLHDQLSDHATAQSLVLADVFVDRNTPPARIVRPGLTELLVRLRRIEGCGVLVASLDHLSPSLPVRQAILVEISNVGGQVLEVATRPATSLR
ncbi:recombinase family protein [Parafrankia sp. BMG5.11]|uniref:recombinase family protein n=1 Tax=Parafrankia sp. BMG5.11 TaxID=222540 RepID=UPI00103E8CB9|nr:recombinase family protein [Parafrankia sp. BMG5.11]TCJ40101.1 recombinase family protein [Parafrankia sp. BMG5.11]